MADNQMTVEQLLVALGQAMLQMSGKMDVLAEKLDAVKNEIAGTTPPSLPGEGFFEAQFGRMEEAVSRITPGSGPSLPIDTGPMTEGLSRVDASIEKLAAGVGEKLDALRDQVAKTEYPAQPGESFFEAQFKRLEEAVSGTASQRGVSSESSDEGSLAPRLSELGDRLEKLLTELNSSVLESSRKSAAGVTEASGLIIDAIGSIPDSVRTMHDALAGKAEGMRAETAANLEKAEEARMNTEKVLSDLTKVGEKTGKAIEAVKNELSAGLGKNAAILAEMQEVTERFAGKAMEDGIRSLNHSAIHHYNIGEYEAAALDLQEAINLDAGRAEVWCNLAHAQAAKGEESEAEASFRKALELKPDLDQAVSGLGVLLLAGGRSGESISFLEKFMTEESPSIRTMIAYSRALAASGRHADAVATLERAASLAPGNPDVKAELAAYTGDTAN
ncbi:MAG: tetratricopeptide repeat protein [Candidatus Fermentibacteraceae bacterium]